MVLGMGPLNRFVYRYLAIYPNNGHNDIIFHMNQPCILKLCLRQPPLYLLSLLQRIWFHESAPRDIKTCLVRETLNFEGLSNHPSFKTKGLTEVGEILHSRCCLGWSLSVGCQQDLCTQIYIYELGKVPNSILITSF